MNRLEQIHAANELGLTRKQAAMNLRMRISAFNSYLSYYGIAWKTRESANHDKLHSGHERWLESPVTFPGHSAPLGSLFDFHPND